MHSTLERFSGSRGRGISWEAVLLAFGTASMPLWPNFILIAGLSPPGVSVVPFPLVVGDFILSMIASATVVVMLAREKCLPSSPPGKYIFWYLSAWILASLLGFDPVTGLLSTLALVMAAAFYHGIVAWYARPHVARAIYATLLITGLCAALFGIVMAVTHRPTMLHVLAHGRATSTFVVPGEFAGYLLLFIPASLGAALVGGSPRFRALGAVAAACAVIALGMTYSRAGWLGAGVGTAFFLYAAKRSGGMSRMRSACVGVVPLAVAVVVGALLFHHDHNPSEDFVRLPIWLAGLRAVELFPLTGTGPGSFRHVYPLLRPISGETFAFHVHNVVLTAFAETGVIGVCALGALWWRFVGSLRARLLAARERPRLLCLLLASGLAATWAQGMLDFVQVVVLGCWLPFMALTLQAGEHGIPDS